MSEENVKVVRALFDSFNAGDMDASREGHDPDVRWRLAEGWPEPGPFVGREAVVRYVDHAELLETVGLRE